MADIGNIDMDRQKRIDESYKKAVDHEKQLGKARVVEFFNDLEEVLREHFRDDWEWSYESDKPLTIFSGSLARLWDRYM